MCGGRDCNGRHIKTRQEIKFEDKYNDYLKFYKNFVIIFIEKVKKGIKKWEQEVQQFFNQKS